MTHIPQGRVVIIVPDYSWGRLVQRAFLDKLCEKLPGVDPSEIRSRLHFRIVTPDQIRLLRGLNACLVLLHNEWHHRADIADIRSVSYQLHHWRHACPDTVKIQDIGEEYYR